MLRQPDQHKRRGGVPLSIYISLVIGLTAIIPLIATVVSILVFLRPALIAQVGTDMQSSARTRIQLIDTYLAERLNDIKTLSEATPLKNLLSGDQASSAIVSDMLFTAFHRDVSNFISISLLDTQGKVVLSYPMQPQAHGKYLVQPWAAQQLQTSDKVLISDVFYDPVANNPSVDLYARVANNNFQSVGIIRASLGLHRLWEPVDNETQVNGAGSYAFVLDDHGVRIAYTNPDRSGFTRPSYLFKSIAPLSDEFAQRIKDENLYGNNVSPVTNVDDNALASYQENVNSPLIFEIQPTGQNQTFEVARYRSTIAPWTYFILKPLSAVTGLADQQLLSVVLIFAFALLLALVIGVQVGRRIAAPIIRSVASLRKNSVSLKTLSDEEQVVATEQSWMVEASQTALQSIKYYTNATNVAVQRLSAISAELQRQREMGYPANSSRGVSEVAEIISYIELAIKHQEAANEKLASALRVTTQATTQLNNGARATDEAATQLEQVVQRLVAVVGEREIPTAE